jgi:hypothetical protein
MQTAQMIGSIQHATTIVGGKTNGARGGFTESTITKKVDGLEKNVKRRLNGNDFALEHGTPDDRGVDLSLEPLRSRRERAAA